MYVNQSVHQLVIAIIIIIIIITSERFNVP